MSEIGWSENSHGAGTNLRAHSPTGIYLGMRCSSQNHADVVHRRLASLFEVTVKSIVRLEGDETVSFFVSGEPDPFGRSWAYRDETTLSATAHPIRTREVLADQSGKSLRHFVRNLRNDSAVLGTMAPPLSYLHHNASRDTIVAANDLMGIGKLYYVDGKNGVVLSNNVLAASMALNFDAVQDDVYWDGYYVTGGGLNDSSFVRDVTLAPPGSVASISQRGLVIRQRHSVGQLLQETKGSIQDLQTPVSAAQELVNELRPYLGSDATLKISGGVDSRFVAAVAMDCDVDFSAQTYVPPLLEGQIARELHERSGRVYPWEEIVANPGTIRQDGGDPQHLDSVLDPIHERASAWFSYLGGDNWSSLIRSNVPDKNVARSNFILSGSHGDFTKAHYYSAKDLKSENSAVPLRRYMQSFVKYRNVLPIDIRRRGAQIVQNTFLEYFIDNVNGYYALDYFFLNQRVRRQFPPVSASVVLPMLTPEMVLATFWCTPQDKIHATAIRKMTERLVPQWTGVPYYHESAVGTDPAVTNKVSAQETYWETDAAEFYESMETALDETDFTGLTLDDVRREIDSLPEGRNRTNQTFEFILWHSAAVRSLKRVNKIRHLYPV